MSRPKVALITSGGAAKGAAHLGVLQAMEELGLAPDILVGASTGALTAALYAQGYSSKDIVSWLRPGRFGAANKTPYFGAGVFLGAPTSAQWRSPLYLLSGLLSIDSLESFLGKHLRHNAFSELERRLLITATDVDGRGRVVFGQGYREEVPISQAVAASCCVPGVFRPYRIGDRYYIDGELVRTLSVDLAIEAGAEVVIVSNVYRPHIARRGERSVAKRGLPAVIRQSLNIVLSEKEKRGIDLIQRDYPHVHVLQVSPNLGRVPFLSPLHQRLTMKRAYREALSVLAKAKRRGVFEVAANVHTIGRA